MDVEPGEEPSAAVARFWSAVDTNLRAGKVRLVFVADSIPPELRRVVEFLNGQMNPAEVLAIEVRQYVGTGLRTLVPTVIGSSAKRSTTSAAARSSFRWNRDLFLEALGATHGAEMAGIAVNIMDWADARLPLIWWGAGSQSGSRFCGVLERGKKL